MIHALLSNNMFNAAVSTADTFVGVLLVITAVNVVIFLGDDDGGRQIRRQKIIEQHHSSAMHQCYITMHRQRFWSKPFGLDAMRLSSDSAGKTEPLIHDTKAIVK